MTEQEDIGKLEQQRKEKLEHIKQLGIDPYGSRFDNAESTQAVRAKFDEKLQSAPGETSPSGGPPQRAICAGRIVLLRDIGKLIFITLRDGSGIIQLGLSKKLLESQWVLIKLIELGDIIGAEGQLGLTKTGELTIWTDKITLLAKSILQPPEKFHGLADTDLRYRQRYVDLWANPEVMLRFKKRIAIVSTIRDFLREKGFYELIGMSTKETIPLPRPGRRRNCCARIIKRWDRGRWPSPRGTMAGREWCRPCIP